MTDDQWDICGLFSPISVQRGQDSIRGFVEIESVGPEFLLVHRQHGLISRNASLLTLNMMNWFKQIHPTYTHVKIFANHIFINGVYWKNKTLSSKTFHRLCINVIHSGHQNTALKFKMFAGGCVVHPGGLEYTQPSANILIFIIAHALQSIYKI